MAAAAKILRRAAARADPPLDRAARHVGEIGISHGRTEPPAAATASIIRPVYGVHVLAA